MADDIERAMSVEEEYDFKEDVLKPLNVNESGAKLSESGTEPGNDKNKMKEDDPRDTRETTPLTFPNNHSSPVEPNGNGVELQDRKAKRPLTKEVDCVAFHVAFLRCFGVTQVLGSGMLWSRCHCFLQPKIPRKLFSGFDGLIGATFQTMKIIWDFCFETFVNCH